MVRNSYSQLLRWPHIVSGLFGVDQGGGRTVISKISDVTKVVANMGPMGNHPISPLN
jgi:hypothetical protein